MRRNSTEDGRRGSQDPATLLNNKNVGDLIYRYETKNDAHIREILSSPQLQHQLDMLYYKNTITPDMRLNDLARIRYIQQQQLQQQQYRNESLLSLTDSEFYSDDQYQDSSYDRSSANEKVAHNLTRFGKFIEMIARLPWPRMSVTGMGICFLLAVFICPRAFGEKMLFPAFRLLFGTLYPAYASYKAVRTKNVKEYVKWMMYWIVYAFFTCIETFTDIFLAWFPFYYEVKVIIVIWLLSPATKGSSTLYRKFVHPMLTRREQEIDEYINQAKDKGYTAVLQLGSKGVNYATNVIMQTALKTFQVPPGQGTIHSSRSDYGISSSSYAASPDTADSAMIRTQSVDSALSLKHQFDGSSEDEDVFLANNDANSNSTPVENSSARIREPPKRKTRSNVTHGITISKKSSKIAVRGRRKLKETIVEPDEMEVVDIE